MNRYKKDFPIFNHLPKLVYLDSTASSLKPKVLIDKANEYYFEYSANVFRGIYKISEKATREFEKTREAVADFIGAKPAEVVFTRNATESLNLVAYSLMRGHLKRGDEVVVSIMEHHANFVPWQQLALEKGIKFRVIDIDDSGYLKSPEKSINRHTRVLALTHVSNVLGTINPIKKISKLARKISPQILVVVDAAQSAPHLKIDVKDLGCDFLAFSAHKMLGPTGVGVLWGKKELLDSLTPFNYGGEMIKEVHVRKSTFEESPYRFEAGTPDIAGVIAFRSTIDYLQKVGLDKIRSHEMKLIAYAFRRLKEEFGRAFRFFGPPDPKNHNGVIAFSFKDYHSHDVAQILADQNICIRAGHHCAMPLHERLNLASTSRASFYLYNDEEDVEKFIKGLKRVAKILR